MNTWDSLSRQVKDKSTGAVKNADTRPVRDVYAQGMMAPQYSALTFPVAAGAHCIYEGELYAAKQAIAASEAWTAAHWDKVQLGAEVAKVGASVADLKSQTAHGLLSGQIKQALLDLFGQLAYVDDDGQEYIDALSDLFFPGVASISAVYTQSGDVLPTDSLNSLKSDLVVTATLTDTTTQVIDAIDYTLSGTLTGGYSTITVTYAGKATTFNCLVAYVLASSAVLDGTDNINTGWKTTYADEISVCFDVTLTGFSGSSKPDFIWSNVGSGTGDDYIGIISRLATNGEYQVWGAGIPNSSYRLNVITGPNERLRAVSTINCQTGVTGIKYYNVTNDVTQNRSTTYSVENIVTTKDIVIGHPVDQSYMYGMRGTIHGFKILGRTMTSAEIDAWLAGE